MKNDRSPFSLEESALTVVPTDLAEPESLIRKLADGMQATHPKQFAGNKPCVYFKFPYIPPCEKFGKLRSLILLIQENTGLRANFHGIVALEATEWVGHEQEEYFISTIKYLFDHSDHLHAALILKNCTGMKLARFLRNICFSVPGINLVESSQLFFSDTERLEEYCRDCLNRANRVVAQASLSLLAQTLMRRELTDARSLSLIDQVLQNLIAFAPNRKIISGTTVQQYLERPDTMLAMMLGAPALGERNQIAHEAHL